MLKDLFLAIPPPLSFPHLQDSCWHRNTHLVVQGYAPCSTQTGAAGSPWAQTLPCFPHKAAHILMFPQEGCYKTLQSTLQFRNTCHWSTLKHYYRKASTISCLFPSRAACLTIYHHLLFRAPLLWGTSHTGHQRNPTGKFSQAEGLSRWGIIGGLPAITSAYSRLPQIAHWIW